MSSELILTLEKGVRTITFNRPKTKNAFNSYFYTTIKNTLDRDADDDNIAMTIITGNGDYYSSGFDIKSALESGGSDNQMTKTKEMIEAFINYPKLLIAVVNGPAIGISVTTAALCDVIYASDRATFETPFARLGLCAEGCSSRTFPLTLGRSKASEMLLLGRKITAVEAQQFNFVSEVVPHDKLGQFVEGLKRQGAELSARSIRVNKGLIRANERAALLECQEREIEQLKECFQSEEFGKGVLRFLNRKSKL